MIIQTGNNILKLGKYVQSRKIVRQIFAQPFMSDVSSWRCHCRPFGWRFASLFSLSYRFRWTGVVLFKDLPDPGR